MDQQVKKLDTKQDYPSFISGPQRVEERNRLLQVVLRRPHMCHGYLSSKILRVPWMLPIAPSHSSSLGVQSFPLWCCDFTDNRDIMMVNVNTVSYHNIRQFLPFSHSLQLYAINPADFVCLGNWFSFCLVCFEGKNKRIDEVSFNVHKKKNKIRQSKKD